MQENEKKNGGRGSGYLGMGVKGRRRADSRKEHTEGFKALAMFCLN